MTVHLTEQECLEIARKWSNSRFVASAERFFVDYAREILVANEEKQAAQEAMRLALEALKAQPRATRISWKDGIDIDVAMAHTKLRDAAIAALEKELT